MNYTVIFERYSYLHPMLSCQHNWHVCISDMICWGTILQPRKLIMHNLTTCVKLFKMSMFGIMWCKLKVIYFIKQMYNSKTFWCTRNWDVCIWFHSCRDNACRDGTCKVPPCIPFHSYIPKREREIGTCVEEVIMDQQVFVEICSRGDGQPVRLMSAKGQRSRRGFC